MSIYLINKSIKNKIRDWEMESPYHNDFISGNINGLRQALNIVKEMSEESHYNQVDKNELLDFTGELESDESIELKQEVIEIIKDFLKGSQHE